MLNEKLENKIRLMGIRLIIRKDGEPEVFQRPDSIQLIVYSSDQEQKSELRLVKDDEEAATFDIKCLKLSRLASRNLISLKDEISALQAIIIMESRYSYRKTESFLYNTVLKKKNDELKKNHGIRNVLGTGKNPYEKLDKLVGLELIKKDIRSTASFALVQKKRRQLGLNNVPVSLHLVFTGNPGTGKTTVARQLAAIYKDIGVLSKGHLVEVDRSSLVAGYVGQTAIKTQKKIQEAMGGILFVDEAYSLVNSGNDFGQEAINTILKAMEDHREDFIVIVAGYPDLMEDFIESNPGLKSRFNKYMEFPDYDTDELIMIFRTFCKEYDYILDRAAENCLRNLIEKVSEEKEDNFANARTIRNLFENVVTAQATRIAFQDCSKDDLSRITGEDIKNAIEDFGSF